MSQALTLARPYARAAFAVASEHGRLPQWSHILGFAAQASAVPAARAVMGNPGIAATALVDLLLPPGDTDPTFRQFLSVLAENRRLALLPEISGLFDALRADAERVVKARVTSAKPLAADELARLADSLRKRFNREVDISTAVDAELIGGAVIDTGELVIDGSIRTKLARLGATLAK